MSVKSTHYQKLLGELSTYLQTVGYCRRRLVGAEQFLSWLEGQGIRCLTKLEVSHGKAYYAYLQQRPNERGGALSPHTIYGYLAEIRLFLRWAVQADYVASCVLPSLSIAVPVLESRPIFSPEQIKLLYAVCSSAREVLLLDLFYGCGLRRTEAERLNRGDVDLAQALLYVRWGKGRKRRVLPLARPIVTTLRTYLYEERPQAITRHTTRSHTRALVLNHCGRRTLGGTYYRHFQALKARTGLAELYHPGLGLHALRHSIATHLLQDGMALERVRDFLGHDSLEATQLYTHLSDYRS